MEITRHDPYDFFIELTEAEFALCKRASDERDITIEAVISMVFVQGLEKIIEDSE